MNRRRLSGLPSMTGVSSGSGRGSASLICVVDVENVSRCGHRDALDVRVGKEGGIVDWGLNGTERKGFQGMRLSNADVEDDDKMKAGLAVLLENWCRWGEKV